jgi:hypothetical protein
LVLQICSLTIPHLKTPDEDFGGFVLWFLVWFSISVLILFVRFGESHLYFPSHMYSDFILTIWLHVIFESIEIWFIKE